MALALAAGSLRLDVSAALTVPSWCGTMERIAFSRAKAKGVLKANRDRSRFDFSPRSPCRARWKKAARFGTRGTSSSMIRVVGRSTRLTCSIG